MPFQLGIIGTIAGIVGLLALLFSTSKGLRDSGKTGWRIFGAIFVVIGLLFAFVQPMAVMTNGWVGIQPGTVYQPVGEGGTGGTGEQIQTNVSGTDRVQTIGTLKVSAIEKNSNVATNVAGTLKIFDKGIKDLSNPNVQAIDTVTVSSGVGSSTNGRIKTDNLYRIAFDGGGTYYDIDYGVTLMPFKDYARETGIFTFEIPSATKIATVSDMLDETGTMTDATLNEYMNGANSSASGAEVYANATDNIWYDESAGDGTFYIIPMFEATTAYAELKEPVMCFDYDRTAPPEGNEISEITMSKYQGDDIREDTGLNDITTYWASQDCVKFRDIKAGEQTRYKLTFTVTEGNLDNNADIWYLEFDDLGDYLGKDLVLNTGATGDSITVNSQA
jgi:hypothetical protein